MYVRQAIALELERAAIWGRKVEGIEVTGDAFEGSIAAAPTTAHPSPVRVFLHPGDYLRLMSEVGAAPERDGPMTYFNGIPFLW